MSLMGKMRAGTDSFLIQALFVVIVVSFVFWGVGGQGPTSSVVAIVDGERVTDTEFQKEMRFYTGGRTVSDEEYAGLAQQVLQGIIERKLLLKEADRLGLEVSDDEVMRQIYKIEAFQKEDGSFSLEMYERYLKLSGTDDVKFREGLYESLLAQKVVSLAETSVQVDPTELKQSYIEENTKLELTWIKVTDAAFMSDVEITDDEVQVFAAANPTRIENTYNAQFERRFNEPRKATLHTILLRSDIEGVAPEAVKERMDGIVLCAPTVDAVGYDGRGDFELTTGGQVAAAEVGDHGTASQLGQPAGVVQLQCIGGRAWLVAVGGMLDGLPMATDGSDVLGFKPLLLEQSLDCLGLALAESLLGPGQVGKADLIGVGQLPQPLT